MNTVFGNIFFQFKEDLSEFFNEQNVGWYFNHDTNFRWESTESFSCLSEDVGENLELSGGSDEHVEPTLVSGVLVSFDVC